MVDRPLQNLHASERAADCPQRPADAEVGEERTLRLEQVRDGEERERSPYGRPVDGSSDEGPVVPEQPPRRFDETTKKRSVSIALPGPIRLSHQPGRAGSP